MLTRKQIAEQVYNAFSGEDRKITHDDSEKAVNTVFTAITNELMVDDGEVRIHEFGSFSIQEVEEHKGRNPKTGEEITIPASRRVKFKAGKSLKDAVNS